MQFQETHRDIMTALAGSDPTGMSLGNLGNTLTAYTSLKISTILRELEGAGLAEMRWEGNPWPGERRAPEATKPKTPQRLFHLTAAGKKALKG